MPLTYDDGPMVWVDCEMTGLDVASDRIIEIAVIITDGRLNPVDDGVSWVIQTPKHVLDAMGEWCTEQHGKSGLTAACLASPHTYDEVAANVLAYIQKWIPEKGAGLLAGSSVHADMRFLLVGMPAVMAHLSYRIVDVSSIKEIARRWYPTLIKQEKRARKTESSHRALDDIQASINELRFYQKNIFVPIEHEALVPEARDGPLKTAI
ncbi:putative RNA exonuclease, partial [Cutaneotrichosporon oleaginosum]